MIKINIIGITDKTPQFSFEKRKLMDSCTHFAGGKRHYKLVKELLPDNAIWEDITIPLTNFLDKIKQSTNNWVVFASGDPLFFGIANTFIREIPEVDVKIYPTFNSLQLLAHKLKLNYGEYKIVTLTGRPWLELDKALINNEPKIALLTDRKKTPAAIAQRMLDAGISNYEMHVGECLGGEQENIQTLNLSKAVKKDFEVPNCLFLTQTEVINTQKGIDEQLFETLPGRPNMITKMPIRLATLSHMKLHNKSVLWDIGACSGSVSIEAKLNYPHLQVVSYEIRPECENIINNNKQKFRSIGIEPIIGDFLVINKTELPKPDALFLGGYGGKMNEILDHANKYLANNGIIAFNSVSPQSAQAFLTWVTNNSFKLKLNTTLAVESHNPIQIIIAEK